MNYYLGIVYRTYEPIHNGQRNWSNNSLAWSNKGILLWAYTRLLVLRKKILLYLKIEHDENANNILIYNVNITQLGLGANIETIRFINRSLHTSHFTQGRAVGWQLAVELELNEGLTAVAG